MAFSFDDGTGGSLIREKKSFVEDEHPNVYEKESHKRQPGHYHQNRPVPPGYQPALRHSTRVTAKAEEIRKRQDLPIGTQMVINVDGKDYLFAIEWHKHQPWEHVDPRLKQWHRGVTVYSR